MNQPMTKRRLEQESIAYQGTGGVSGENRVHGFYPAFRDEGTGQVYLSRYSDGRPAPFHLLDGLPCEMVLARDALGRVTAVKTPLTSGFLCDGYFYSRDEAAERASMEAQCSAFA